MPTDSETIAFATPSMRRSIVYAALSSRPEPKLGAQIGEMDRMLYFTKDPLQTAIRRLKRVLFPWMVLDFRRHPTKTKAICIFDMYLSDGNDEDKTYVKLRDRMETVRQNSELAKSMSWLKRVATSSSRTVDSNIFDDMFRLHMLGSSTDRTMRAGHQQLFREIMATPSTTSLSSELSAAVREIRQTCLDAGFSMTNLGLTDSFA